MTGFGQNTLALALARISAALDQSDLEQAVNFIAALYGVRSIAFLGTGIVPDPAEPLLAVTYASEWVEHYKRQRYAAIDPVIQQGFRRLLPFDWADFGSFEGRVRQLFGEACEFGLGRHGLTIPVRGPGGDRSLFTITSNLAVREWQLLKEEGLRDFQVLAFHVHEKARQLSGGLVQSQRLSPRELECLQWIAEGKTAWECGMILGLSEHTVRCYLESARHKLNAVSNTHAVSLAHSAGLFLPRL